MSGGPRASKELAPRYIQLMFVLCCASRWHQQAGAKKMTWVQGSVCDCTLSSCYEYNCTNAYFKIGLEWSWRKTDDGQNSIIKQRFKKTVLYRISSSPSRQYLQHKNTYLSYMFYELLIPHNGLCTKSGTLVLGLSCHVWTLHACKSPTEGCCTGTCTLKNSNNFKV